MLCQEPDDLCVAEQLGHVAVDQDQIEVIGAVGFLDQLELAIEVRRLVFRRRHLLPPAARFRANVGAIRNTSETMFLV